MSEMNVFQHPEFGKVRVVVIGGEPWLVGKDVAMALGYSDTFGALKKHVTTRTNKTAKTTVLKRHGE